MDILSIIIDRVGKINVFNIIQGRLPSQDTHLQTIVDDDLISEFLAEIERLSRISNSISDHGGAPSIDVSGELRKIGETFFHQFFPEPIQERLKKMDRGNLFMHVDYSLRNIPWELLHDGSCFLGDKFFVGKNVAGLWVDYNRRERDHLRVLIIADPTEDLEWARIEGEGLYESLNAEVSADRLDVHLMVGKRITKLSLLNALKDRDVIHYAGHVYYSEDHRESGWLLYGDKILRAREIEKAGITPDLVFSNSCLSYPAGSNSPSDKPVDMSSRFNDLAGAFLKAGIANYIGTNWEIRDNRRTYDFALHFYRSIFEGKSVGESLFDARLHARRSFPSFDLTWANYLLHGYPDTHIIRKTNKRVYDASRNILLSKQIAGDYPSPVARQYESFLKYAEGTPDFREILLRLIGVQDATIRTIGAIVFGNYQYLGMKGEFPPRDRETTIKSWTDSIFDVLTNMSAVQMELVAAGMIESLYHHRESIYKMLNWASDIRENRIPEEDYSSYSVTFQYLLDNLLGDLSMLRRNHLVYIPLEGDTATKLHGVKNEEFRILPAEFKEPVFRSNLDRCRGNVCFYNSSRKILFSLNDYVFLDKKSGELFFRHFNEKGKDSLASS